MEETTLCASCDVNQKMNLLTKRLAENKESLDQPDVGAVNGIDDKESKERISSVPVYHLVICDRNPVTVGQMCKCAYPLRTASYLCGFDFVQSITRQPLELESSSNHLRSREVF